MNSYIVERNRKPWKNYRALLRTAPSPGSIDSVKDSPGARPDSRWVPVSRSFAGSDGSHPKHWVHQLASAQLPCTTSVRQDPSPILLGMEKEEV